MNVVILVLLSKSRKIMYKWMYELSGNDYRVATLSKLYLSVTGIPIEIFEALNFEYITPPPLNKR